MSEESSAIVWFRHDLRLSDNPALHAALETGSKIVPVFIYDEKGEGEWKAGAASKWWLYYSLKSLIVDLQTLGSNLVLLKGPSEKTLLDLCVKLGARSVYWNRRYEPAIVERDTLIKKSLAEKSIEARSFNGSLLHSPLSIANKAGLPFKVFTPFWKHIQNIGTRSPLERPKGIPAPKTWPQGDSLDSLSLLPTIDWDGGLREEWYPGERGAERSLASFAESAVNRYASDRDSPAIRGVSRLSPYLHFGEVSPNQIWHRLDRAKHEPYLRQIAWREFAHHLMFHFKDTPEKPLRPEFEAFPWKRNESWLTAWQQGRTGYPIIDAGMRELWHTGWMHNRVRMIVSSFLVKHLLIPWQDGAAWFWDTLVDADLANNTMGWQWVAGCGADAAPYFRIFNPMTQGERFDGEGDYTRHWVPELKGVPNKFLFKPWEAPADVLERAGVDLGNDYPLPIVGHSEGRQAALDAYAKMKEAR